LFFLLFSCNRIQKTKYQSVDETLVAKSVPPEPDVWPDQTNITAPEETDTSYQEEINDCIFDQSTQTDDFPNINSDNEFQYRFQSTVPGKHR